MKDDVGYEQVDGRNERPQEPHEAPDFDSDTDLKLHGTRCRYAFYWRTR